MTEGSELPKLMKFQVCDVHKPLLSATKVCDMNYRCVLERNGGYLEDKETGDVIPLHRRGSLYVMNIWVKESGFSGRGEIRRQCRRSRKGRPGADPAPGHPRRTRAGTLGSPYKFKDSDRAHHSGSWQGKR